MTDSRIRRGQSAPAISTSKPAAPKPSAAEPAESAKGWLSTRPSSPKNRAINVAAKPTAAGQSKATTAKTNANIEQVFALNKLGPGNIPEHLPLDVTELGIGDALRISELKAPEGVEVVDDLEKVIVHVAHPAAEEVAAVVEAEAVEGEVAEPEVLRKGKAVTEEEGEEKETKEKEKKEKKEK